MNKVLFTTREELYMYLEHIVRFRKIVNFVLREKKQPIKVIKIAFENVSILNIIVD